MDSSDFPQRKRQSTGAPCPGGNGTTIGTIQQFVVSCDSTFQGIQVLQQEAPSFQACTNLCSTFQNPPCQAAQYASDGTCILLANVEFSAGTLGSDLFDSARALFPDPPPTSSCAAQGTGTNFLSRSSRFSLQCGMILNGRDLLQQFAMTFQACLAACSANPRCGGISYDPAQSAGFQNCYLKTAFAASDLVADQPIDSAVIVNGAVASAASSSATAASTAAPVVVTMTVSGSAVPDTSSTTGPNRFSGFQTSSSSSAWIAAPVVGGVAVFMLIAAIFILYGRRRKRDDSASRSARASYRDHSSARNPLGRFSQATERFWRGEGGGVKGQWPGDEERTENYSENDKGRHSRSRSTFKVVSGSGRRLGPDADFTANTGPGIGGMIVTTGGGRLVSGTRPGSISRHDSTSSAGLRDSRDGLRQNRLESIPGIPAEFHGPIV